jgi:hypothetical protein
MATSKKIIILTAAAATVALLAGCGTQAATSTAPRAPAATVSPAGAAAPTVTRTVPAPVRTRTVVVVPQPQKTVYVPAPAPAAPASALRDIGGGVYAGPTTSTPFALAVVAAWQRDPVPGIKYVYSPVTGQTYAMSYSTPGASAVIATGGNGAYVQF